MADNPNKPEFTRTERIGVITLSVILLGLFVFWRLMPTLFADTSKDATNQAWQDKWTAFEKEHLADSSQQRSQAFSDYLEESAGENVSSTQLFYFDPNQASLSDFIALGVPEKTAQTIIKYRSKGGKFRKSEDLQKIYTLQAEVYKRIAPYIRISSESTNWVSNYPQKNFDKNSRYTEPSSVSVNTASKEQLQQLRGVGPAYAAKIISVRNRLGGFLNLEQFESLCALPDSTFQAIKDKLEIDSKAIQKIDINQASKEALEQHPYIGSKLAESIILLRNDLKGFKKIEQLRMVPLINEEKYRKIVPYISIN